MRGTTGSRPRRHSSKRLLLLVVGCLLAACGGSEATSAPDVGTVPTAMADVESSATPTAAGAETPTSVGDATRIGTDAPATPPAPPSPSATASPPDEPRFVVEGQLGLDVSEVNSLIEFVEATAGRPFVNPPTIVPQDRTAFEEGFAPDRDRLDLIDAPYFDDMDTYVRGLQALGLTDLGVTEVTAAIRTFVGSTDRTIGYFDPVDDRLHLMTEGTDSDLAASVLVHELTHALDDQYAPLDRLVPFFAAANAANDFEEFRGFAAVVEGRATFVEQAWMRSHPSSQGAAPRDLSPAIPRFVLSSIGFPYSTGSAVIGFLGGAANTWPLLDDPWPTSAAVLAIDGHDIELVDVTEPAADGPIIHSGVWGAADVYAWVTTSAGHPTESSETLALSAAGGWAGGRFVLWGDNNESCMRIALAGESRKELDEMAVAVDMWVEQARPQDDRTAAIDDDLLGVTGCAPFMP